MLVIGDRHMADPAYLISPLHEALTAEGATVHSYSACGIPAGDWTRKRRTMCGAATRSAAGPVEGFPEKAGSTTPYGEMQGALKPDLAVVIEPRGQVTCSTGRLSK